MNAMSRAVWCDTKTAGHALNEHDAIVVTGSDGAFFYCGPHNFDALNKALIIAHEEGKCGFRFPPVGDFTITSEASRAPATPEPPSRPMRA
jgi:hypothetical protein